MTSGDGGYRIGVREVYELLMQVSAKLDQSTSLHSQQIGANTQRIEDLGKGMRMMWERFEKDKGELKGDIREVKEDVEGKQGATWQVNLAIGTSIVSILTALAGLLIK